VGSFFEDDIDDYDATIVFLTKKADSRYPFPPVKAIKMMTSSKLEKTT